MCSSVCRLIRPAASTNCWARSHEPITLYCAVIIEEDRQLLAVEDKLDQIHRLVPVGYENVPFHATEIFGGGRAPFKRGQPGSPTQTEFERLRAEIAPRLGSLPMQLAIPICIGGLDRRCLTLPKHQGKARKAIQIGAPFVRCLSMVELWFRRNAPHENYRLVIEDNQEWRGRFDKVVRLLQEEAFCEELRADMDYGSAELYPFRSMLGEPIFEGKRAGSALELADFCAYVIKRMAMKRDDAIYSQYFEAFSRQIFTVTSLELPSL